VVLALPFAIEGGRPTTGVGAKPFFVGAEAPGSWKVKLPARRSSDV